MNVNVTYYDFAGKLMSVIDEIAPIKVCVNKRTGKRFDSEVAESITERDKLFKKFKKSQLQIDKEWFNAARNRNQSLISNKETPFFHWMTILTSQRKSLNFIQK